MTPRFLLLLAALSLSGLLSGCQDGELPRWFTGEPMGPTANEKATPPDAWPNLADVPDRPTVTPIPAREQQSAELKAENDDAQKFRDLYDSDKIRAEYAKDAKENQQ